MDINRFSKRITCKRRCVCIAHVSEKSFRNLEMTDASDKWFVESKDEVFIRRLGILLRKRKPVFRASSIIVDD